MVEISTGQWESVLIQDAIAQGQELSIWSVYDPEEYALAVDAVIGCGYLNYADRCLLAWDRAVLAISQDHGRPRMEIGRETARLMCTGLMQVRKYEKLGGKLSRRAIALLRRTYLINDRKCIQLLAAMPKEDQITFASRVVLEGCAGTKLDIMVKNLTR